MRGTLSAVGSGFEFCVLRAGTVIRHQRYTNVRRALEAAREWRVDYEMERAQGAYLTATGFQCSECGDEVSLGAQVGDDCWLCCQACGHAWKLSGNS